jgi:hypothetical protein
MGFVRASQLLALIALAAAPAASAAAAQVTLSSGASRNCTGEMSFRMASQPGQPPTNGESQTEAMRETLSMRLTGGQYEIRHNATDPQGETLLIAHIRPDGIVADATLSGPMVATMSSNSAGSDQLRRLSMLAARMLPERLVMGREFRPGDNLYTEADTQDILAGLTGLTGAMGLPPDFQMEATGGVPFTGATGDGAGRTLNFAGPISAQGSGDLGGQSMRFDFSGQASTVMDATTGLLRGSTMEGTMDIKVNGASQLVMHMRQSMTCIITSGTA